MIVENIIPRNVIINRGAAEVDNQFSRDDICDYHPLRECNIYFIIPNTRLDSFFFTSPVENQNDLELDFKVFFFVDSGC